MRYTSFNFVSGSKTIFLFTLMFLGIIYLPAQCPPVASYSFSGNTNDVSGNGNHGLPGGVNPPLLTTDRFGNPNSAYEFGGYYNPNWIRVPNSATLQFTNTISISMWFRQCSFGGMDGNGFYSANGSFVLLSKAGDGFAADPGIWSVTQTNTNNTLNISFNNTNDSVNNNFNFVEDTTFMCFDTCEWVHCVVIVDQTDWRMYINGKLVKQTTIPMADFTEANNRDLLIGRMDGGGIIWYPFNGIIDDIDIYNCALAQVDVDVLFNNFVDPLAYNNTITIDSIGITNSCSLGAELSVYASPQSVSYQYSLNAGMQQFSNVFSGLSPGSYSLRVISSCTFRDTTYVIPNPTVTKTISANICQGQQYQLPGGGLAFAAGVYTDTISSAGCDSIYVVTLSVTPVFTVNITDSVCTGQNYLLPSGAVVNLPGTYYDTFQSAAGCDSIITTNLFLYPEISDSVSVNNVSCFGNDDGMIRFVPDITGAAFELNGDSNMTGFFVNLSPGYYSYSITDLHGCTIYGNAIVDEPDPVRIILSPADLTIEAGSGITITATSNFPNATYLWTPGTFLNCDTCSSQSLTPLNSIEYTLYVTVKKQGVTCTADTNILIRVIPIIFAPNAFTPNGDGLNDFFRLHLANEDEILSFQIRIFNRWGEQIMHYDNSKVSAFQWDGKYKGVDSPEGVYEYIYEYSVASRNGIASFSKSGRVTIIR